MNKVIESLVKQICESSTEDVDREAKIENFKAELKKNPTRKKIISLAKKYGYKVDGCYIRRFGKNHQTFDIQFYPIDRNSYLPDIRFNDNIYGGDLGYTINASAYGSMNAKEFSKFIKDQTSAYNLVSELEKMDTKDLPVDDEE